MFKIVRLIIRISFLLFIGLLVLAFFTNPSMDEFKKNAKEQLNAQIKSQTDNPSLSYIAALGLDFTDKIIDQLVVRKNYYICSVYTVQLPDGNYSFLGAFHIFYPLQDKNPFDSVKQKFDQFNQ